MSDTPFRFNFSAMGSPCELLICADSRAKAELAAEAGVAEVKRIEHKYSRYRPDSLVSAINARAGSGEWSEFDNETAWLLNFADTLYSNSEGLFDITSGVLRRVWNFDKALIPSLAALEAVLPLIAWSRVEIKNKAIRLPEAGMEIDFGGFGKEYAADSAAVALQKKGIAHGYVNLGGDIRVIGPQPGDSSPWKMAIQDPRQRDEIVATIPVFQGGLATSGDYEKYFEHDGRRYCHVMNPKTGVPVSYWQSVSIVAPLAIVAGSCSTITMLMEEKGGDWMKKSGFSYLGISNDGNRVSS